MRPPGRDESNAALSQGRPRISSNPQKLGRGKEGFGNVRSCEFQVVSLSLPHCLYLRLRIIA